MTDGVVSCLTCNTPMYMKTADGPPVECTPCHAGCKTGCTGSIDVCVNGDCNDGYDPEEGNTNKCIEDAACVA